MGYPKLVVAEPHAVAREESDCSRYITVFSSFFFFCYYFFVFRYDTRDRGHRSLSGLRLQHDNSRDGYTNSTIRRYERARTAETALLMTGHSAHEMPRGPAVTVDGSDWSSERDCSTKRVARSDTRQALRRGEKGADRG